MNVQPYLFFDGRCEEALKFYEKSLGAKVEMLMRYKESPEPPPPGMKVVPEQIMRSSVRVGASVVMAADDCMGTPKFGGFSLTVGAENESEAKKRFDALAQGGTVKMPLTKTFFSPAFGMLTDRFGVGWMIMVETNQAEGQ